MAEAGGIPVLIPLVSNQAALGAYERIDGLLLPGGADVDPAHYGAAPHPAVEDIDQDRDRVELLLCRRAIAEGLPLLGVCRGLQLMNVAMGGTLVQHIPDELPDSELHHDSSVRSGFSRDHLAHAVSVAEGSALAELLEARSVLVNSSHHQAIDQLAPALRASATAADGVIEGVEGPPGGAFCIGVQWHPEAFGQDNPVTRRLFSAFIDAARVHGAARERAGI